MTVRAGGYRVSIEVASLCVLAAMPAQAHAGGFGSLYSSRYWFASAYAKPGHGHGHGNGHQCPAPQPPGNPSGPAKWSDGQGTSANWSDRSSWSTRQAPSGAQSVAQFGASRRTTIQVDTTTTVGTLSFDASSPAYTFNIGAPYTLTLAGDGIRSQASGPQTFNVSGRLNFTNRASAGNAALVAAGRGIIDFSGVISGTPTAGSIAGSGTYFLGRNTLEVGSLETNTTFGGEILDGSVRGGSLRKVGRGSLTLTGRNQYTGSTTIAGVLDVVSGGRVEGTSNITIADLAGQTGVLRVAGVQSSIATAGGIVVGNAGRGALTLEDGAIVSAASVLLGSGTGSTGVLNLGSGAAAGFLNAASVLGGSGSGSAVNINHSGSAYTVGANLLGALTVNHNGTGTTTLTGTNSYSGGTNLNAGALRINANANLGSTTGALNFNGGTLQAGATITNFTHPVSLGSRGGTIDTGTFNVTTTGAVSGAGRLTKTGSGTLTLNGTSTHTGGTTVSAGVLRGTSGSLAGNIVNDASVVFLQNGNGTYSGTMSGRGTLTKLNPGNLELSGANTFTGGTTISSGTLTVNGSLVSAVTVGESGTLGGTGTINAPVTISGVLAPGGSGANAIGMLTVRNGVTFADGSRYRVDADSSGRADQLSVTGAASIADATVEVVANPTGTWRPQTRYTIVTASGGVGGQFSDVATDLAFLTPSLSYDSSNVYLTLTRNETTLSSVARSNEQVSTARYMQTLEAKSGNSDEMDSVLHSVTASSVTQAQNLFEQIGAAELTRLSRMSKANTSKVVDLLVARMAARESLASGAEGGHPHSRFVAPEGQALEGDFAAGQGLWMRNLSVSSGESVLNEGAGSVSSSFHWRSTGVVAGFDTSPAENTLVGLSISYARSEAALDDEGNSFAQALTPQALLYAMSERGPFALSAVMGYALPRYRTERQLSLLGSAPAVASYSGREVSVYTEAAFELDRGESQSLQPLVAVRYVNSREGDRTESGSTGSLAISGRASTSLASEIGARFVREWTQQRAGLQLRAAWSRDFSADPSSLTAHLARDTSGESFTVTDGSTARDRFLMDTMLTARLRNDLTLRLEYSIDAPIGSSPRQLLSFGVSRTW